MDENLDEVGDDDDFGINDIVNSDIVSLMGGLFSSAAAPDPLRDAVKNEDNDLAKMLINDGADPFFASTTIWDPDGVSAFQLKAISGCCWPWRPCKVVHGTSAFFYQGMQFSIRLHGDDPLFLAQVHVREISSTACCILQWKVWRS